MPPASRGWIYLRVIRRHASTAPPIKTTQKPPSNKYPTSIKSPSQPSRPQPSQSQPRNTKAQGSKPGPEDPGRNQNGRLRGLLQDPRYRDWRRLIIAVPALILAGMHFPYGALTVSGPSMAPFFNPNSADGLPTENDVIIIRWPNSPSDQDRKTRKEPETNEEQKSEFHRGQIVTFAAPHDAQKTAVKRIVALPGDIVQPLYGYPGGDAPVVVPWNHLWVEGDAGLRKESQDSNTYGPISQNLVSGEVIAVWSSWLKFDWIDGRKDTWPARKDGRVEENAIMEATVDPDDVLYSSGWRNGSIALVLEQMRRQPDRVLYTFVNDPNLRQQARRLYNNALYVADVATSEQEKALARDVVKEMEEIYGREALVYGIRMKKQPRDRGELPDLVNSKAGENTSKDQTASEAEKWLKNQGWQLERNVDGTVKTHLSSSVTTSS